MHHRALPTHAAALLWTLSPLAISETASASMAPAGGDDFHFEAWPGDWGELAGLTPVGDGRFVA